MSYTQQVANYIEQWPEQEVSDELLEMAKLAFMDWIGVTIAGSTEEATQLLLPLLEKNGGAPESSIIGTNQKTSMLWAALVNGTAAHALDFDDICATGPLHFEAPIISAAYALGEANKIDGRKFLHSIIVGVQVMGAVDAAIAPNHYKSGWHSTSTMGRFGATAAVGYLLKLNEEQLCHALGIAASQVAGIHASFGTMTKPLHAGKAAMDSVLSSQLAAGFFTARTDILDRGLLELLSSEVKLERIEEVLQGPWIMFDLRFKRFPCGVATHPCIMCGMELGEKYQIKPDEVETITARVYPRAFQCASIPKPTTGLEGKFSAQYCLAAGLIDGDVGILSFEDEAVLRPEVQGLLGKIHMECEPNYEKSRSTTVTIKCVDGRIVEHTTNPFVHVGNRDKVRQDVTAKFKGLLRPVIGEAATDELTELVMNVEKCGTIGEVAGLIAQAIGTSKRG